MKTLLLAAALLLAAPAHAQTCALHASKAPDAKATRLAGLGNLHHAVTASPAAQAWFDQGLRLTYAFNHDAAVRSFQEAARVDPSCAMCFWGVGLALGPNINMPMGAEARTQAATSVKQAEFLATKGNPAERAWIAALQTRYTGKPTADADYAAAMTALAAVYPKDADAQTLLGEALLDLRPWDQWTHDGKPQPGTLDAVAAFDRAHALDPDHPGAHHFRIHALEGSLHPEQALSDAVALPKLMPGAGHLVHMPAHIFMRLGRYADASAANDAAIQVDEKYLAQTHAQGTYAAMYVAHNFAFLWVSALMEGNRDRSLRAARGLVAHLPLEEVRAIKKEAPTIDFMLAAPLLVMVRFQMWKELLAEPALPADLTYLSGVGHFARAMALAALKEKAASKKEQALFDAFVASVPQTDAMGPANPARDVLEVAQAQLQGDLARLSGDLAGAVEPLRRATKLQDALHYDEPAPWPLFARVDLGEALLGLHQASEAAEVARADLHENPENGWALSVLWRAQQASRAPDAQAVHQRLLRVWPSAKVPR
jgi:tetratricopeptide (TPR) repeat protein